MRSVALVVLVSFLCGACFSYVPARAELAATGDPVQVYLSQPQTVRLDEVSASNIVRVRGEVAAVRDDELVVSAWNLYSGAGNEFQAQGRTVRLPAEAVERVERKELSWIRSGAILAAGVLAGVLFVAGAEAMGGEGRDPGGPSTGK